MVELSKAFSAAGLSVYQLLVAPGMGFYIPLYQREYSWETNNVQQLIDDLSNGVDTLYTQEKEEDVIRFLGTIITIEADKEKIKPQDPTALPSEIRLIIDGQQRITTLILLASQLYLQILQAETKIKKLGPPFTNIVEACISWRGKLKSMFTLNLGWGDPPIKPKIIRGQKDWWIREGDISVAYTSPATKYISEFIEFISEVESGNKPFSIKDAPGFDKDAEGEEHMVASSVKLMRTWLTTTVARAHLDKKKDDFPSAELLIQTVKNQKFIWGYDRPELKLLIEESDVQNIKSGASHICSLVQIFAVAYYLLERCCFTVIQPTNEKWGLDMFQSLNATGTPLTAIETFKPSVVNTNEVIEQKDFKGSDDALWFKKAEDLFEGKSASEKNRLTNDFLTSFALVTDAEEQKLSSQFSEQRKWLDNVYSKLGRNSEAGSAEKHVFIKFFGQYADFYRHIRHDNWLSAGTALPLLTGRPEAELATVILLYLNKSNHRMAITILAQYYILAQNASPEEKNARADDFIAAVKAVGAFYTLWRCAQTNSGLDAKYRAFFKGSGDKSEEGDKFFQNTVAWLQRKQDPTVAQLKQHLYESLKSNSSADGKDKDKKTFTKEVWLRKATFNLVYDSKQVVKFVLLLYAHDSIPDITNPGLAKFGRHNVNNCMTINIWNSPDTATIEHVAPQKASGTWDSTIYNDNSFNQIGNLILLPGKFNSSAGNKGWDEKLIYYRHLGENDQDIVDKLTEEALAKGYTLVPSTIKLMQQATHQAHIKVILDIDTVRPWDATFIAERTERILSMTWDKLIKWLEY